MTPDPYLPTADPISLVTPVKDPVVDAFCLNPYSNILGMKVPKPMTPKRKEMVDRELYTNTLFLYVQHHVKWLIRKKKLTFCQELYGKIFCTEQIEYP